MKNPVDTLIGGLAALIMGIIIYTYGQHPVAVVNLLMWIITPFFYIYLVGMVIHALRQATRTDPYRTREHYWRF